MPPETARIPHLLQIARDVLEHAYPGHEVISIELPRAQPRPAEAEIRAVEGDVARTPPLAELQAHFRDLGFSTAERRLPDFREPESALDQNDPGIIRCRIRPRQTADPDAEESDVLISIAERSIVLP